MSSKDSEIPSTEAMEIWENMIEQLRCYVCKNYLSCSPLRVLPDGNSICGRCTPPNNEAPVYRNLTMENALQKITFSCLFEKQGCLERLPFGHVFQHEAVCAYKTFACFALPLGFCTWEGSTFEIVDHFSKNHEEYLMKANELQINVEEGTKEGLFMYEIHDVMAVIYYHYNPDKKEFKYSIRYIAVQDPQIFCKVTMYNDVNRNYCVSLKKNAGAFQFDAVVPENETVLNMKPYLEILGNPTVIAFRVDFGNIENFAINYKLLESLKCSVCGIYVTPPIFKRLNGELICGSCAEKNSKSSALNDPNLEAIMADINYPCRWEPCRAAEKVDTIREHEKRCTFRVFVCPILGCHKSFKRGGAVDHFTEWHSDHKYFNSEFKFVVTDARINLFTLKMDEVIIIRCVNENNRFVYDLIPTSMAEYITLHFEHYHCPNKSRKFNAKQSAQIGENLITQNSQDMRPKPCCSASFLRFAAVLTVK